MDVLLIIGRVLFSLIFISSGLSHLTKVEAMSGYAQFKKVPAPKVAVIVTGLMIIIGGLYIALGVYADLGGLLLAIFLLALDAGDGHTGGFHKGIVHAGCPSLMPSRRSSNSAPACCKAARVWVSGCQKLRRDASSNRFANWAEAEGFSLAMRSRMSGSRMKVCANCW